MTGCNKMYCDETTNATNILKHPVWHKYNITLDNENRSAKRCRKKSAIFNFLRPTFENAIAFEPFEISTADWHYFAQD
jgi:hypothetical protein